MDITQRYGGIEYAVTYSTSFKKWELELNSDDDDRDDDWSEDFECYMTETGWLSEEER